MSSQGLTLEQAAAALGKSTKTIRRYIASGKIKAEMHKGQYRILEIPVTRQKPPGQTGQRQTVQSGQT
jgi:Predicted site-specific integrase-resolvase